MFFALQSLFRFLLVLHFRLNCTSTCSSQLKNKLERSLQSYFARSPQREEKKKKRSHFISSETILSKNTFRLIDTCLEVPWNLNLFPLMLRIMSRLTMNRKCVCSDVCISVAFMYQHTFSIASQFCCRKNRQAPFGWLNLRYYLIAEHALYLSISWLIKGWWSLINLNRMCDWRAINQYSMWMHIRHTMQCDLKQKDIIQ